MKFSRDQDFKKINRITQPCYSKIKCDEQTDKLFETIILEVPMGIDEKALKNNWLKNERGDIGLFMDFSGDSNQKYKKIQQSLFQISKQKNILKYIYCADYIDVYHHTRHWGNYCGVYNLIIKPKKGHFPVWLQNRLISATHQGEIAPKKVTIPFLPLKKHAALLWTYM